MITIEEAIKILEQLHPFDSYPDYMSEFPPPTQALNMAKEALKKQDAQHPIAGGSFGPCSFTACPVCEAEVGDFQPYCIECGQRIKWPEDEELDTFICDIESEDEQSIQTYYHEAILKWLKQGRYEILI